MGGEGWMKGTENIQISCIVKNKGFRINGAEYGDIFCPNEFINHGYKPKSDQICRLEEVQKLVPGGGC